MSRLRQPEEVPLIKGFFVYVIPPTGKLVPRLAYHYPESCLDDLGDLTTQIPLFCFPYDDKSSVAIKKQEFTFVFTDAEGYYVFGYCLQKEPPTPASEAQCLCVVSQRPFARLFRKVLPALHELWSRKLTTPISNLLSRLMGHYSTGVPESSQFSVRVEDGISKVYTFRCAEVLRDLGYDDPLLEDPDVEVLLRALKPANLVTLFASVLFERRVIVVSEDIGVATGCVTGVERLCHPISWEGVYITIMPNHLLDYCSAPMPFLVGLHSSNWTAVQRIPLEDVVLVLADEDKIVTPFNDGDMLPSELSQKLKAVVKYAQSKPRGSTSMIGADKKFCATVANVIDKLIGDYREHIRRQSDRKIEIDVTSFVTAKPKSYTHARNMLAASQSLRAYVDRMIHKMSISNPTPVSSPAPGVRTPNGAARAMDTGAGTGPPIHLPTLTATEAGVIAVSPPAPTPTNVAGLLAVPSSPMAAKRRLSMKSFVFLREFRKSRPDLASVGKPAVFKVIWLGSANVQDTDTVATVAENTIDRVLLAKGHPVPALVLVFAHTVIVIDQRSRLVLEEFSTERILHCGITVKTLGSGTSAFPLLAFVSSRSDASERAGHVLATKDDKLKHDVMHELEQVCQYLVARSTAVHAGSHNQPTSNAIKNPTRKSHAVRFVGSCRLDNADTVTRPWLTAMLRTREMPSSEVVLLLTRTSVRFVEPLTQRVLHENATRATTKVVWVPWAGARWTRTTATGDLTAGAMRMSDDERVAVMQMVRTGQLTTDQAMDAVMRKEKSLTDVCLCYSWENTDLGVTECVLFGCTEGKEKAEELMHDIGYFRSRSRAKGDKSGTTLVAMDKGPAADPTAQPVTCVSALAHATVDSTAVAPLSLEGETEDDDDRGMDDVCRMLAAMQAAMDQSTEAAAKAD
eukprot:m.868309 g.868309  ORF g.868309 m.868309 type:complete len:911 (+) comp23561_c0_seq1:394-3126(+)